MLHAPISENKTGAGPPHSEPMVRHRPSTPNAYGNQAMLRIGVQRGSPALPPSRAGVLQRKCACGRDSAETAGNSLAIGEPGDAFEQEADRVAERVMRMPDAPTNAPHGRTLQRKCAACEEEDKAKLQTKRQPSADSPASAPPLVHEVLRSPGEPLDAQTRAFMEPRFGRDFTAVRTHTDGKAAESARAVQALAYTVGTDVVFAQQQYAPATPSGKRLLAHELAHVVQHEGPAAAPTQLRRKVTVEPTAAVDEVLGYFNVICPQNFKSRGDSIRSNGPNPGGKAKDPNPGGKGCRCLRDAASSWRTFTIKVVPSTADVEGKILFDGSFDSVPAPSMTPFTSSDTHPHIEIPAQGSEIEFGAFDAGGVGFWVPIWRILAHEICGHGLLKLDLVGAAATYQRGQDKTVDVENDIMAEYGQIQRGHFADPRQGASFFNIAGNRSKVLFNLADGTHFESPLPSKTASPAGDFPEPDPNPNPAVA